MPPKEPYFLPLAPDNSVRIRITTDKGDVITFTVQYETWLDGEWVPVVRYDTAHGQAHIDFLDHGGRKIGKTDLGFFYPYNTALQWCLEDIDANWTLYKERFDARRENQ